MPRLMQVEAFPEEHRVAVRAVAAAMAADGRNPDEYTAEVYPGARGLLEVSARHDSHPADWHGRGAACRPFSVARYTTTTGRGLRIFGIR